MNLVLRVFAVTAWVLFSVTIGLSQENPNRYNVKGRLVDSKTREPVPFAQVALFVVAKSGPEAFTTTDNDGRFSMLAPEGTYIIKFFSFGYEDKEIPDLVLKGNRDLGTIEAESGTQQLEEVVIEGRRSMMTTTVEGIVIIPDMNLSNIGGTLLDILRNTPSVRVGDDGSVTLRGSSGTNVLINGRNSSLTNNLDRIPASAIEQIKIINNPNARYDAEAEAGIIDIILKKGDNLGTNVAVDAVYGTRGRMSTGAQVNHRTLDFNVYGGYNFRRWRSVGTRRIEREIFGDDEILNQETASSSANTDHNFNYGADYYFGKNVLSYQGLFSTSLDKEVNTLYSNLSQLSTEQLLLEYVRRNDESETDDGIDNALIYERTFDNKDRSFKFSATQSYTNQYKTQNIDIFRNASLPNAEDLDGREMAITDEKRFNYIFQADYVHPLNDNIKFETGLKSNIRNFEYDFDYARLDDTSGNFVDDPAISNRFDYKDRIHAAYLIFARSSDKFDITAGIRGELTLFDTYLFNTDERNDQEYFNLFPSLQALYNATGKHGFKLTYSRRIDRPTAWRLNPFPDITDSLTVRRGNPNLQPEMIHSMEIGHIFQDDISSLTTNFFYRHVKGQLDYLTFVENGISYSQPENLNNASSYGIELIGMTDPLSWWTISGSFTGYQIDVDGSNISDEFVNSGFAYNTKIASDFRLPWDLMLQLVFNYDSPEIEAQGRDFEQYFLDVSLQRSFFDKKGSLSISARDIFDTRRFMGFNLTDTFSQNFFSKRETRIILVSARYSF